MDARAGATVAASAGALWPYGRSSGNGRPAAAGARGLYSSGTSYAPRGPRPDARARARVCEQGRAEREAQGRQALGAQHAACPARPPLALGLLFDPLPVAQSGMGRAAGLARAPPLAGARTR